MTPQQRAERRLLEAVEQVRRSARAAGVDADRIAEYYAPWQLRADAWLERTRRLLDRPQ